MLSYIDEDDISLLSEIRVESGTGYGFSGGITADKEGN